MNPMKLVKRIRQTGFSFWMATALVVINLFTWTRMLSTAQEPYVVEPIMDPEVEALLAHIRSGNHSGESWEITLTELEAEQTITWYLKRWPQIPFAHPKVSITPDFIAGEGDATIAGIRIHAGGQGRVTIEDGLPVVEIHDLSLPLPRPLRQALEQEIRSQLQRAHELPVRFTSAEWGEGKVTVRGTIR